MACFDDMSRGVLTVSSNVCEPNEIVIDGLNGMLAPKTQRTSNRTRSIAL